MRPADWLRGGNITGQGCVFSLFQGLDLVAIEKSEKTLGPKCLPDLESVRIAFLYPKTDMGPYLKSAFPIFNPQGLIFGQGDKTAKSRRVHKKPYEFSISS